MRPFKLALVLLVAVLFVLPAWGQEEVHVEVDVGPGAPGASSLMRYFFTAMFQNDLVILNDFGVIAGALSFESLQITVEEGAARPLAADELASLQFGASDRAALVGEEVLVGKLSIVGMRIAGPGGATVELPREALHTVLFKPKPVEHVIQGEEGERRVVMVQATGSLTLQNLPAMFAQSLSTHDLAVFRDGRVWSGAFPGQEVVFESGLFGRFTFPLERVALLELAADPEVESDFVTLKTGDRLSGTLVGEVALPFSPVAPASDSDDALSLTRESVRQIVFRQPASAFGGGRGPGFGGGPGK